MYLKEIAIKNIWPIEELYVKLPFYDNWTPKPVIFVWENWTWKTIIESQITDWLYEIWSKLFNDVWKYKWFTKSYYKISWWFNLKIWKKIWFSLLSFNDKNWNKIEYFDKIWNVGIEDFKELISDFSLLPDWQENNTKKITEFNTDISENLEKEWLRWAYFYQPAYRYEEPFWKNEDFFDNGRFKDKRNFTWNLNKDIEIISSLEDNKTFLMNLVLDFASNPGDIIDKITWSNINNVLRKIKKKENIRFWIWPRWSYRISIVETDENSNVKETLLPSIDNLSLWESVLLNLFINIIRHWDNPPKIAQQIEWIVVIDEIDIHLHSDLQNSVLPELIKMFPRIQFIITTHAPLFLLWMENVLWEWNFEIRNMPNWEIITCERFSEFKRAYEIMKNTEEFEKWVKESISNRTKPIVYVEWPTDVIYLTKAYELYWKSMDNFNIEIIWRIEENNIYDSNNKALKGAERFLKCNLNIINQKIIILNDPERNWQPVSYWNLLFVKKMPKFENHILERGIENLFENDFINSIKTANPNWFSCLRQGDSDSNYRILNKMDVCTWICENWTVDDFKNFEWIFEIIDSVINDIN